MTSADEAEELEKAVRHYAADKTWSWTRQTMNYVGQLAGQVFVQVKELYRGLNPATLSGCIDVIAVRRPDGSLRCSPFHVRFGKSGVLSSREKVVDMEINGEPVDLHMKLGDNGEAFFVREMENNREALPSHLATSPIPWDGFLLSGPPAQNPGSAGTAANKKRRKRRRRKARPDDGYSEVFAIDITSDEELESESEPALLREAAAVKPSAVYARSDGDWSPLHSPRNWRPASPKSDSELATETSRDSAVRWAWGELPQPAAPSFLSANPESPPPPVMFGAAPCEASSPGRWRSEPVTAATETDTSETGSSAGKTDPRSEKKDKRSRHLGADGVYLDDLTELEPEVAALYFPKSGGEATGRSPSPRSLSSGGDSGADGPTGDLPAVAISLCGGLDDDKEIGQERFRAEMVSYQRFARDPAVIDDPDLVVKIGSKYYNWSTAAPIVLAMQAFRKPLPKAAVEDIVKEKMPKKGRRWWFSWRGQNGKSDSLSERGLRGSARRTEESSSADEDGEAGRRGARYKKTLRLDSEQLRSLRLREGPNRVVFSVTTQYQGTRRCQGTIYLWNWDDKMVISDLDGTVARSDTQGHILPTLGKDWTHRGIAQLYHKVSQNGYKILYCSARVVGTADGYLRRVDERGAVLPAGPVLLCPGGLFSAPRREVFEKKPEKFKVECLSDIRNLFYPNTQPFYAAFGSRPTDAFSYKEVGVPLNRIFTVNPQGELVRENAETDVSPYVRSVEEADHVFPSPSDFPCAATDAYGHFADWRRQLSLPDRAAAHAS
ncbi:phosphatidate phosphatase LPIN1 [Corythoichthys intestinalis]|uniref:phosphatidate phosphatase LPIN1 n=1 Tax=Corythoichthys intestinalis TaxID=161448 RepID=UPI0025A64E27|nr:phosphatidate phosphatase LPIN1 [Corythoichthys intestinalis]